MKELIYKYLNRHYIVEPSNYVIKIISLDGYKVIYINQLCESISTIFGIPYNKVYMLTCYWLKEKKDSISSLIIKELDKFNVILTRTDWNIIDNQRNTISLEKLISILSKYNDFSERLDDIIDVWYIEKQGEFLNKHLKFNGDN